MSIRVDDLPLYVGEGLPHLPPPTSPVPTGSCDDELITNPWLELLAVRANSWWQRQRWYRHHLVNPRHDSRVLRHVFAPLDQVVERLRVTPWPEQIEPRSTWRDRRGPVADAGWELDARIALPWSWPALPARVAVRPWSSGRATLHLELAPGLRPRYPRRWFLVGHELLENLSQAASTDEPQGRTS